MGYIALDFEATCWEVHHALMVQEIIEIGAYFVDIYGHVSSPFQRCIRPVQHPLLSPYCRKLTGITQEEVSRAANFPSMLRALDTWLETFDEPHGVLVWGSKDRLLFESDCRYHRQDSHLLDLPFIDIKLMYHELFRLPSRMGLQAVLKREGLGKSDVTHRALPDAEGLVRIFLKHRDIWPIV